MAQKVSQQEGAKRDFIQRFADKYAEWVLIRKKDNEEHIWARTLEKRVETDPALPGHVIYGFNEEIKSLEYFLLNPKFYKEFKSLVVVGQYGVGKTALCKTIFNGDDVTNVYAPRIWVSMHSNESNEALDGKICALRKILMGLGVEYGMLEFMETEAVEAHRRNLEAGEFGGEIAKEKELSALLYALHLNLRWKKYLIVFDDVREEDNWNEKLDEKLKDDEKWGKYLSDGFPKGSGGRVIYTTRDERLANKLVAEKHEIHRLWPLSDSLRVWDIYKEELLKKKIEPPRNNNKCIEDLMNKSRGLPLAARLLATLDPGFVDDTNITRDDST